MVKGGETMGHQGGAMVYHQCWHAGESGLIWGACNDGGE